MGADDKLSNKAQEAKGKVKEGVGRATGDERLEASGKDDQAGSRFKQAGEKAKDSAKKIKNAFKS
ncbi:CsbD family protein [Streptosporangium amethystogenes]|uniref:CsbD family protein n=1 Tax=Streptosporangium amethystogenes TaxID=2002 RepID=UPI0037BAC19F